MKILFVENHSIFAKQVIDSFLPGHDVTVIPSLAAAKADLTKNHYDVLLVDYNLDDGKGAELIRELRKKEARCELSESPRATRATRHCSKQAQTRSVAKCTSTKSKRCSNPRAIASESFI